MVALAWLSSCLHTHDRLGSPFSHGSLPQFHIHTQTHTHTQTLACALSDPCVGSTRAHRWIIGYVCHELRNPLHILKAAVSSLLERAADSRPNSAQGGARSTGAGPLAVLSPGGGGGDVGTAPLVGTGPLPARPKLSPLQHSVASPPVPMKPSMSRGLRCVFSASGIALWLLRVGHATQGPSQVPQPRCPSLTTSASHSVTMTLSLVVHGSRFPPLCSVVSISVAFVCKQWWWGGPHPSPTQHRHWVRLHHCSFLASISDPLYREVAADALAAIDRMECTVNDVSTQCGGP